MPLVWTKLQPPRLTGDLFPRQQLLDRLNAGSDSKLTLISAMAGAGKTTLLAQWIKECPQPSAWLSLDDSDNDHVVFLTCLCAAIRSVYPRACQECLDLLNGTQVPPVSVVATSIANELNELTAMQSMENGETSTQLVLVLDDYHHISDPAIHEIMASLIEHWPPGAHLVLATRIDPQLPLARLRAAGEMTEVRTSNLRFTLEETRVFLEGITGRKLDHETIRFLEDKTEGWGAGLRLAALSLQSQPDVETFIRGFRMTGNDFIAEYLLSEVLAAQPVEVLDFLLRTSVLDRFCVPLCEVMTGLSAASAQEIIDWMVRANLFLVPFDDEVRWYRYHHLFRDLMRHEIGQRYSAADIAGLHMRAGTWFAENGMTDEALRQFLAADDTAAAVDLVGRCRRDLMNRAKWAQLGQLLRRFPPAIVDQHPELLLLKTWLVYYQGRYAELPAAVQKIEEALARAALAPEAAEPLQGEVNVLRSLCSGLVADTETALAFARQALDKLPHEAWIVRTAARLYMAVALQTMGDVNSAYEAVYTALQEEGDGGNALKSTVLTEACFIHWMAADLSGLALAAGQALALSRDPHSPAYEAWGHYHLGKARYHQSDLAAAEKHFAAVVRQPYLSYGNCYAYGACGLAQTHQALGRPEQAREVIETAIAFLLETGNTTLLPVVLAFQAELAVMQGQIAAAVQHAARFEPVPPLSVMYGTHSTHLALVRVWLAQDTESARERAGDLLGQVRAFCESTHNMRFLIETLALQAVLHGMEGDEPAALSALRQAVALAEPGGFVQLFVDLGPSMASLLNKLRRQGVAPDYVSQVLGAFPRPATMEPAAGLSSQYVLSTDGRLIEPLTPRELEVLALLNSHLTHKEIAAELVISYATVKTHTLNIYRKLDASKRREAVARAQELGLIHNLSISERR